MKKHVWTVVLVFGLILGLRAQGPQAPQMKLEDVQKALCLVDKTQPAPDKFKAGLEAITGKDSIAMLTYIASDLLEGRETATRGYALAAEYAASLFKLWGVKPAGDMPMMMGGFRMGGGRGQAPQPPRERTYFQDFAMKETADTQSDITIEVNKAGALKSRTFHGGLDFQGAMGGMGGAAEGTVTAPVVFVGYGISEPAAGFDELKGLNLKGKIVLVIGDAPGRDDPKSPLQSKKELKDKYFPAMPQGGDMMAMMMRGGPQRFNKLEAIAKMEPAAIVQVSPTGTDAAVFNALSYVRKPSDDQPIINRPRRRLSLAGVSGGMDMGRFGASATTITREMANFLLEGTGQTIDGLKKKIDAAYKPASMDVAGAKMTIASSAKVALVRGTNVLGLIEGSDPKLKDEYFVVGAHYDHNGAWDGYVWNGADDNGSGSVGVLNIAKAFAASPVKPKRTIIFALWTGEEEGLLGSRYYAANPVWPIDKTVGYLNYDMISRPYDAETLARTARMFAQAGAEAEALVKKVRAPWFVSVNLTEGTPFADIAREMNQYVGLDLFFRFNALGQGGGGSDHSSFAAVKVPYVYYMAAMTADYHQPSDSVEKVSGELIAKISQHGYLTVYAFADR